MPFFVSPYNAKDIVFLGTSITAAATYITDVRTLVLNMSPYYSLETLSNLSAGGSRTFWALAQLEETVQGLAPDVICIEENANDDVSDYFKKTEEAIIRRIRSLLPNTRIVYIACPRVTNPAVDDATNQDADVQAQWKTICDHYGVVTVDWSAELYTLINTNGGTLSDYLSDTVHPTTTGHASIAGLLDTPLNTALGAGSLGSVPSRLYDCAAFEDTPVWRDGDDNDGEMGTGWSGTGTRESSTANDTITWNFNGVSFGFVTGTAAGVVGVTIDGGSEDTYDLAVYGSVINHISELSDGNHTVVFRVISGTVQLESFISI